MFANVYEWGNLGHTSGSCSRFQIERYLILCYLLYFLSKIIDWIRHEASCSALFNSFKSVGITLQYHESALKLHNFFMQSYLASAVVKKATIFRFGVVIERRDRHSARSRAHRERASLRKWSFLATPSAENCRGAFTCCEIDRSALLFLLLLVLFFRDVTSRHASLFRFKAIGVTLFEQLIAAFWFY